MARPEADEVPRQERLVSVQDMLDVAEDMMDLVWHMSEFPDPTIKFADVEEAIIDLIMQLKKVNEHDIAYPADEERFDKLRLAIKTAPPVGRPKK